jgi:hypothetical protein
VQESFPSARPEFPTKDEEIFNDLVSLSFHFKFLSFILITLYILRNGDVSGKLPPLRHANKVNFVPSFKISLFKRFP